MFARIRFALGTAAALLLLTSITVFAKGGFDFLIVTGRDLKEAIHIDDTRLTSDFFTFANFYEDRTEAPADPGQGYEITRHYQQGSGSVIFDRLYYYPDAGFVYYDGIENGDSEYDDGWYTADPEVKTIFESALAVRTGAARSAERRQPLPSAESTTALPALRSSWVVTIAVAAGLAAFLVLAFLRRKPSAR